MWGAELVVCCWRSAQAIGQAKAQAIVHAAPLDGVRCLNLAASIKTQLADASTASSSNSNSGKPRSGRGHRQQPEGRQSIEFSAIGDLLVVNECQNGRRSCPPGEERNRSHDDEDHKVQLDHQGALSLAETRHE
jgi:hypothetical protein